MPPRTSRRAVLAGCAGIATSLAGCSLLGWKEPTVRWTYDTLGASFGSVAIADGTIYSSSTGQTCSAIDFASGEKVWEIDSLQSSVNGVAVSKGRIVGGDDKGYLYALGMDGTKQWQTALDGAIYCQKPLIVDDTVVINARNGTVYGVALSDGEIKWEQSVVESLPEEWRNITARPISADGLAIVGSYDDHVRAFDIADGTIQWDVTVNGNVGATVAHGEKYLVAVSWDGDVVGLDPSSGDIAWQRRLQPPPTFDPACADGRVYVPTKEKLFALQQTDGRTDWRQADGVWGDVTANAGIVVYAIENTLQALSTEGDPRWRFDGRNDQGIQVIGPPVVTENEVVATDTGGDLHTLERIE